MFWIPLSRTPLKPSLNSEITLALNKEAASLHWHLIISLQRRRLTRHSSSGIGTVCCFFVTYLSITHSSHSLRVCLHCLHYSYDWLAKTYSSVWDATRVQRLWDTCFGHANLWVASGTPFLRHSHICVIQLLAPTSSLPFFGVLLLDQKATMHQANAIAFASLLARRLVLFHWKSAKPHSFMQWVKEVMPSLPLEKVRYTVHGSRQKFNLTWSPLIQYVESLSFT